MIDTIQALARARAVIAAESAAIHRTRLALGESFISALTLLYQCSGKIVVSGMGKVGHVGTRFAATLCSTGQPAVFLHPGEASHGDLGIVATGDIVIALSNSGKTREVIEVAERIGRQNTIVVVTGDRDSPLTRHAMVTLCYGPVMEPCHLGLTPSASLAAMSALLDALAIALSEQRGFTFDDFHFRHHSGYIGEKLAARAEER